MKLWNWNWNWNWKRKQGVPCTYVAPCLFLKIWKAPLKSNVHFACWLMKPTPFSVLTIKSISILLVLLGQLDSTLIFLLGHNKEVGILDLTSRLRYVQNRARFGVQSIFNAIPICLLTFLLKFSISFCSIIILLFLLLDSIIRIS